jgi:hypothetical protein
MSLYFPDTGYVQGMAALAATLLAYYDEEHTFIMLVRLWQLRGLEKLYRSGFAGLMEALGDFEREWLEGGEVAAKLVCCSFPADTVARILTASLDRTWNSTYSIRYSLVLNLV